MSYGAMIDVNGNPFVTPNSTPFCLYSRTVHGSVYVDGNYQQSQVYIPVPQQYPSMTFVKTSYTALPTAITSFRSGSSIYVNAQNQNNQSFSMTVYIFAIFPQTLPQWGMAIWDANGQLVLTNESRVLSDLTTIGTPGPSGGINIDTGFTLPGSWAVCPARTGSTQIQTSSGGSQIPIVVTVDAYSCANFNGANTRINSGSGQTVTGSVTGNTNTGVSLVAINTAAYD